MFTVAGHAPHMAHEKLIITPDILVYYYMDCICIVNIAIGYYHIMPKTLDSSIPIEMYTV